MAEKPKSAKDLRRWLDVKGLTIQAFADSIDTRPTTVSSWLRGTRRPVAKRAEVVERATSGVVRASEWGVGKQRSWSDADDAELRRLHNLGLSDRKIADALGRTVSSVRTRRCNLGEVNRRWRSAAVSEAPSHALIAELRERGYAVTEAQPHGGVVSF